MAAYRDERGVWHWRKMVHYPDGSKRREGGTPDVNTKPAAEDHERSTVERLLREFYKPPRKEVPLFKDWFNGRFFREWVLANKTKPSEVAQKKSTFKLYLCEAFGEKRLDDIDDALIANFKANLIERTGDDKLGDKRVNNILTVLSKALHYAKDVRIIPFVPTIGMLKVEPPEIVPWDFEQYGAALVSAQAEGYIWYVAALLAGDEGLRAGEIRALEWETGIDLVGKTITVMQQSWHGIVGTPKGRTRRVVPMTERVYEALKGLEVLRRGPVVRNMGPVDGHPDLDGAAMTDGQMDRRIDIIYRRAKLAEAGWHRLRHTYATDAARFGVNPWTLMQWLGHKSIEQTLEYVNLAKQHQRPIPPEVLEAGKNEQDPDRRVVLMLGARGNVVATAKEASEQGV
jgi:integrase